MHRPLAAAALILVITGCTATTPSPAGRTQAPTARAEAAPPFEIVAGGGTDAFAGKAIDRKLTGAVRDLELAPDGTVNLLISSDGPDQLQRITPDGTLTKIDLDYAQNIGRQIAVGPDGSTYVNLNVGRASRDAVYRINPDGSRRPVIGYDAAVAGIDDSPGRATGKFTALTIDAEGRLVFAADVTKSGKAGTVMRRVEADGSVRTIAGKPAEFTTLDAAKAASAAALHPSASGAPLDWATTAAVHVDELATQPDGTIALEVIGSDSDMVAESILTLTPRGELSELAASQLRGMGGEPVSPAPFTREGTVEEIGVLYNGMSAADGLLAVSTTKRPPEDTSRYYNGRYTPGQQAILRKARGKAIRLIRPDGSFSTAALGADFALHGGYLYVVCRDFLANELVLGRVKIPA
ncbi:hypothetical protein [Kribbella sp. NPDC023855]|uniref:hypothetical protein n=1 Tax=Kribbella sp. NPDC023855 TaxID=3154698 RepID=UPI0033D2489C